MLHTWGEVLLTFFFFLNFFFCGFRTRSKPIHGSIWRQSVFSFILTLHHRWPPAAVRSLRHGSARPPPTQLPATAWSKSALRLTPATVFAFPTVSGIQKVSPSRFSGTLDSCLKTDFTFTEVSSHLGDLSGGVSLPLPPHLNSRWQQGCSRLF